MNSNVVTLREWRFLTGKRSPLGRKAQRALDNDVAMGRVKVFTSRHALRRELERLKGQLMLPL